jgi:hypothetical protein
VLKLFGLAIVKNESDVIEQFVRHNLRFLDRLFIIDNDSCDNTVEIIRSLASEGLPIELWIDPEPLHLQSKKLTAAYHKISREHDFDFLFLLDADEFIRACRREEVEDILLANRDADVLLIPWQTYVLTGNRSRSDDLFRRISYRRKSELRLYHKAIIRHRKDTAERDVIADGNHNVYSDLHLIRRRIKLPLAHFPVRSKDQLIYKSVCAWLSIISRSADSKTANSGSQRKAVYDAILCHGDIGQNELRRFSYWYSTREMHMPATEVKRSVETVRDQMQWKGVRKYRPKDMGVLVSVLRTAESIIDKKMSGTQAKIDQAYFAKHRSKRRISGELEALNRRIAALEGSTSWRITRPIRIAGKLFKWTLRVARRIARRFFPTLGWAARR